MAGAVSRRTGMRGRWVAVQQQIVVEIVTRRWKSAAPCKISVLKDDAGFVLKAIDLSRQDEERTTLAAVLSDADIHRLAEALLAA
jgi:hypothetical protein